jgi:Na+-transporting NADH:ubiquinone oxidoreductase subunit B
VFQKQLIMRRVLYALIPLFLFAVYLYGWRVPVLTAMVFILGVLTEYLMLRGSLAVKKKDGTKTKKKISEAVLVTCALYSLALPPAVPLWIAGVGIVFAVFMGKMVFGGFGRNVFNPAITGRLFIYITFPTVLAVSWMSPGNFGIDAVIGSATEYSADAVSAATPLAVLRAGELPDILELLFGLHAGAIGESSSVLILLAAVYLIATKTANWKIMLSTIVSAGVFSTIFFFSVLSSLPPHYALLSLVSIFSLHLC